MIPPLTTYNTRMLDLMKQAVAKGIVAHQGEYCEKIGIKHSNLVHIRSGQRSFTVEQILAAAELMDKPMDWFFNRKVKLSGPEMIREGLRIVEEDLKAAKKSK